MKHGRPQAKDVPDALALEAVSDAMHHYPVIFVAWGQVVGGDAEPWHGPANMGDIVSELPYPYRVVAAKVDSMVRRGLLVDHGSTYSITEAGLAILRVNAPPSPPGSWP